MSIGSQFSRDPSPIEAMFWEAALPRIPNLQREIPIGDYRADFLIPDKKIIIELEGYLYHQGKQKRTQDAQRERYLELRGYRVITFTGSEIFKDVHRCVDQAVQIASLAKSASFATRPHSTSAPDQRRRFPATPALSPKANEVEQQQSQAIDDVPLPHTVTPPRLPHRAKPRMKPWQLAVIGGLGLAAAVVMGLLLSLVYSTTAALVPNIAKPTSVVLTRIIHNTATAQSQPTTIDGVVTQTVLGSSAPPAPPLLSPNSALRVTDCPIDWSLPWRSITRGERTTITPPVGATCGIFNFRVSAGEMPTIVFNDERYTDLGSCLNGCVVRIRAVSVSIDVQGLEKSDAAWSVSYYWNSRGPN